jgi:hypothetical protein
MSRLLSPALLLALTVVSAPAADVTLDGVALPRATSTMSIPVDVTEFREGGGGCPRLLPGCAKPTVCVTVATPVPALDGQVAGNPPARFSVGVEDGRTFVQCLLASLNTDGGGARRHYVYCLRCEGVTGP